MALAEITIKIKVDEETFNENEVRCGIVSNFEEVTGYEVDSVDICIEDSE